MYNVMLQINEFNKAKNYGSLIQLDHIIKRNFKIIISNFVGFNSTKQ